MCAKKYLPKTSSQIDYWENKRKNAAVRFRCQITGPAQKQVEKHAVGATVVQGNDSEALQKVASIICVSLDNIQERL